MAEPTSFDEAEIYDDEESFDTGLLSHFADYALSVGFEHLTYLGWEHDLVFGDMKALQADIRQNPKKWEQIRDSLSIPFHSQTSYNRDWVPPEHYSTLYWSHSKHDSTLCILVQFASASLLERYLDHAALMPSAGANPLVYAVHFDRVQHARILLSRGAKVNDIDWVVGKPRQALPLELAVEKRAIELVDLLLAAWSRVPEQLFEICVQRAGTVPLRIIRSLFQTDEFPEWIIEHQDKQSLLHNILPQWAYRDVANEGGVLVDITRRLIQVGCDPSAHNSRGQTLLDVMIAEGGVSVVEYLILEHMQMSSNILLAVARAWKNPVPMMHMLVDKGADVHVQTSDGDSVLHVVIDRDLTGMSGVESLLETVKVLVDSGCNPAVCNSAGKTPLHVAATKGHVSVVRYMLSLDILLPPDILLAAVRARECRGRVMRLLVDKGADIHARTCDGDSVLHVALHQAESEETLDLPVTRGRPNGDVLVKLVMLLVHMGCNPAVCNYDGKMPIHIAAAAGNLDVVQYLLSRGIPLPPDILLTNMPVRSPSKKREKRRMHAPSRQIYDAPPYLPLGRLGTESLEFNKANHYLHPLLRYQYHDLTWQSNTSAI
jgi:ankyrin repeat protein